MWTSKKEVWGYNIKNKRGFWIFTTESHIRIYHKDVEKWCNALSRIIQRVKDARFRSFPISDSWKCMLGAKNSEGKRVYYYGALPSNDHIVQFDDEFFVIYGRYERSAIPIKHQELESFLLQLTV